MDSKKQIKFGAIISYIAIALDIIAGLIFTPWMVKSLGEGDYAIYTVVNSVISLFLIDFGLSTATSKYVSELHANNRDDEVPAFLGMIYKLYFIVDAVILCIFVGIFFFLGDIYQNFTPEEISKLEVAFIFSGGFAVFSFPFVTLNGVLNSYEKFVQMKFSNVLNRLLSVGLMSISLLFDFGLYGIVASNVISGTVVIIYKLIVLKINGFNVDFRNSSHDYKGIFKFSLWTTLSTIAGRLIFNIMPTVLGIFSNSHAIAVFGVVITLEGYSYTFSAAINGMFMPKISSIYARNKSPNDEILELAIKVGKFQFGLCSLITVGLILVGKDFLAIWMGENYLDAYICSILVIIPSVLFNPLQIANTAMVVENKVHLQALVHVTTGILNVVLSFILVPMFGLIGACYSICISYFFRVVILLFVLRNKMEFNVLKFSKECYLKMFIPAMLTIALGLPAVYFITEQSWKFLCIKIVIITAIYGLMVFLTAVTKEEKNVLYKSIYRIFKKNR